MRFVIALLIVSGSVIFGYTLHGGNLLILYQPTEYLIIVGAGIGSFIIANSGANIKAVVKSLKYLFRAAPHTKQDYLDLLLLQFKVFKLIKSKGMLAIESHIEDPYSSDIFTEFPSVTKDHHAVDFFCDYLRMVTMGVDNKYVLEDMMEKELDHHHHEKEEIASAVVTLGDAFPAIGIVAAVLGVIITMGSISEPPEILGKLIGAALVGTFLGILLSYGFVGPMGQYLGKYFTVEHAYYQCIKVGLISHVQGDAPAVSVEFARKVIPSYCIPSFKELEDSLSNT